MTLQKVREVAAMYRATVFAKTLAQDRCEPIEYTHNSKYDQWAHAAWMCDELQTMEDMEKACRWLGFIQGVLWANKEFGIGELRAHSRTL